MTNRITGYNNTYKKLAVQRLNEALRPAWRDFVVADRLVLRLCHEVKAYVL
ncbi:MAG: hypothetical protein SGJ00_10060 [bacterium]|nr:hypothetical protein [bacterium]